MEINNLKRIHFRDFWSNFQKKNNYFTILLKKYGYKFEIVDSEPNIIIFSVFGNYRFNLRKNIKNCFYTGENRQIVKNANLNLTFENTSEYNNIRLPLWILYDYNKKNEIRKKRIR